MILLAGCFTAFFVHTSPDADYPSGRSPVYFWIAAAVLILAPAYLLSHLFGQERGNAIATAVVFSLFSIGPFLAIARPASLQLLYAPLSRETWIGLEKTRAAGFCWLFITRLFALGAWWSAFATFTRRQTVPRKRRNADFSPRD